MLLKLAVSQMLFNSIFQFANLFINTYLFKQNADLQTVALFNIYMYAAWMLFFYIGYLICQHNSRIGISISGLAALAGTVALLTGLDSPLLIGTCIGASGGLFWSAYLAIYQTLGSRSEQGSTFAKTAVLGSLPTVFMPLVLGLIVEGRGYSTAFIFITGLAVALFVTSFLLPSTAVSRVKITTDIFRHPRFNSSLVLQGIFLSFVNLAAGLLVYMSGAGEARMGLFATFYGLVTVSLNFIIGFHIPNRYARLLLFVGASIYFISSFLFFTDWINRIIAFNFLIAAAGALFNSSIVGLHFGYMNNAYRTKPEGVIVRELGFTIGRITMFSYMAVVGLDVNSAVFLSFLITISTFPLLVFALTYKLDNNQKPAAEVKTEQG